MFISVDCIDDNNGVYSYRLRDSEFKYDEAFRWSFVDQLINETTTVRAIVVLRGYLQKGDPKTIPSNLIQYYIKRFDYFEDKNDRLRRIISMDRKDIDNLYPDIQYGNKYYPCVLRKLDQSCYHKGFK